MENGRPQSLEKSCAGGSTRRKGLDEARRPLDRRPTRLCLGDPRLALMGVVLVVVGTERDNGFLAGGADFAGETGLRMNRDALAGVPSMFFDRFDGELNSDGSMFSESSDSSKVVVDKRRFPGDASDCFARGEESEAVMAATHTGQPLNFNTPHFYCG